MFEVQNLSKSYSKKEVLKNISLKIEAGQMLGLLGRNGSGKSTLMRLLAKREIFDGGEILYQGQSFRHSDVAINPDLVFVSEDQVLPLNIPLSEWVSIYQGLNEKYDLNIWNKLVADFDLDVSKTYLQLSRGQKVKAWFALQAPKIPKIYILDEVTSVLDSGSRLALMQFLKSECQRGSAVVISTNIASELQGFASHIALLTEKSMVLNCSVNELDKYFVKIKGDSAQNMKGAKAVQLNSDGSWSYLLKKGSAVNVPASSLDRRGITLEDVAAYYSMRGE